MNLQIVYCAWIAFELVFVYFYLVETKNKTLEETSVYVLLVLLGHAIILTVFSFLGSSMVPVLWHSCKAMPRLQQKVPSHRTRRRRSAKKS